jgi:hypothetical protein
MSPLRRRPSLFAQVPHGNVGGLGGASHAEALMALRDTAKRATSPPPRSAVRSTRAGSA